VKNSFRILSLVIVTAIYCLAITLVTKSFTHSDIQKHPISSEEKIISDLSTKQFCHISPPESSVTNINNLPVPNFKNPFTGFWAIVKTTERLFNSKFSQYTSIARESLINQRKCDLLFPFHYFW
jgi:hypothetical protein